MKNKDANAEKLLLKKNASVSVKVANVKTEEITLDFVANGNFEPKQELAFSAEKLEK
jgi:hypothetical protein